MFLAKEGGAMREEKMRENKLFCACEGTLSVIHCTLHSEMRLLRKLDLGGYLWVKKYMFICWF